MKACLNKYLYTALLSINSEVYPNKCTSTEEWINKTWFICTLECYLTTEKERNSATNYNTDEP